MPTEIGRLGVWTWLDAFSAPEAAAFAQRLEEWGYGTLWIPEAVGRDPFSPPRISRRKSALSSDLT